MREDSAVEADEGETEQDRRTREEVEKMGRDNGLFRHASPGQ
jgi:hypothetical protein